MHPFTDRDMATMHTLNQAAVPATGSVDLATLTSLCEQAVAVPSRRDGGSLCAFMILLDERADYASPNFRWFKQRLAQFLYVDRVVVDERYRARGLGRALYVDAAELAAARDVPITCEVNIEPPNPQSMGFHQRLGFQAMGEQRTEGGKKQVRLLVQRAPSALLDASSRRSQ